MDPQLSSLQLCSKSFMVSIRCNPLKVIKTRLQPHHPILRSKQHKRAKLILSHHPHPVHNACRKGEINGSIVAMSSWLGCSQICMQTKRCIFVSIKTSMGVAAAFKPRDLRQCRLSQPGRKPPNRPQQFPL